MTGDPTEKSIGVEAALTALNDGASRKVSIHERACIQPPLGCGRSVGDEINAWPEINRREYAISGWCYDCQERVFQDPEEETVTETAGEARDTARTLNPTWTPPSPGARRHKPLRKFRKIAEPNSLLSSDDPQRIIGEEVVHDIIDIDVVTSESAVAWTGGVLGDMFEPMHYPAIDVDHDITVHAWAPHKHAVRFGVVPHPGYRAAARLQGRFIDAGLVVSDEAKQGTLTWGYVYLDAPAWIVPSNRPDAYALFIDKAVHADAYFDLLDALAEAGVVEAGYAEVSRKRGYSAVRPFWVNKPEEAF